MCIIRSIYDFALKGVKVFLRASAGNFHEESKEVKHMKEEVMNHPSTIATDRQNLREDRRAVYRDIHKAFHKITVKKAEAFD